MIRRNTRILSLMAVTAIMLACVTPTFLAPAPTPLPRRGKSVGTNLLRKEVIHPQLPLRMPCYDLVPIIELTFVPVRGLRVLPTLLT